MDKTYFEISTCSAIIGRRHGTKEEIRSIESLVCFVQNCHPVDSAGVALLATERYNNEICF